MDNLLQRVRLALADRYDIKVEVGRGGMAVVYLGTDLRHDRSVAVKVLPPHLASAVGHERFLQEIQVSAGLSHPYILPLLDSGQADGLLYYVMPFVEGENLSERLDREPQLPIEEALRIADEMAEALGHAHAFNIVHRDVKPSNILLTHEHALLADFGVAFAIGRGADADQRLTGTGLIIGTPAYMSPQQSLPDGRIDGASDQYSLACVIYEMLAGRSPFAAPSPDAVLRSHVMDTPPRIRTRRPDVPVAVEAALARALSKSPDERFPSMEAFAAALRVPATGAASTVASPGPRKALVAGGVLLLAAAAFGISTLGGGGSDSSVAGGPGTESAAYQLALLPCQAVEAADSVLGRNLANGVFLSLQGVPGIRMTPYGQSLTWAEDQALLDVPLADSVAAAREHLGASTLGTCTVRSVAQDSVVVDYQLHGEDGSFTTKRLLLVRETESMAAVDPFVIELTNLLCEGSTSCGSSFRPTENIQAFSYYMEADDHFLGGRFHEAEHYFGRAADADPGFALARWRQADARRWRAGPSPKDIDLRKLFAEQGARLGTRDSLLLWAIIETPGPLAFEQFEAVLRLLPRDAYAMLLYGDELLHRGPLWGVTLDSAESVLETATYLNSRFAPAWAHLAQVRIRLGMEAEAATAVERLEELSNPQSRTNPLPLDVIWGHGWLERFDPDSADANRAVLEEAVGILSYVTRLVRYGDLPRAQLELGKALIHHPETETGNSMWHSGLNAMGLAYAALGQPEAALEAFSDAADLTPAAALFADQWAVVPVALGLEGFSEGAAMQAADRLSVIATDTSEVALHRARAAWTLALFSLAGGFERWQSIVVSLPDSASVIAPLARHLEAVALSRDDRWQDAIALSRSLVAYDSVGSIERPFGRAAIYLTRGRWFQEAQEPDSAIAAWTWHLNTDLEGVAYRRVQAGEVDGAYGSHARLRIARIANETGRADLRVRACSEAHEVVRRWANSEPSLADPFTEAKQIVATACPP